jgi:hypothetical protein
MVEVEVAHRDDVDRRGVEAGSPEGRHDPRTVVGPHRPGLVVEPVADAGLDEHSPGRRLDEEAVERLEESVLAVQLSGGPAVPEEARHRPEEGARVGPEGAGLDEGDRDPAAEVAAPVDGVVQSRLSVSGPVGTRVPVKSRWNADAVGSDWPWYFDPSEGEPYGRSTGELILKNEIWPIFISK